MSHRPHNRTSPAALATTAGALVALVAVAAMMTSTVNAASLSTRGGTTEARQTINEGAKVRAAVAAVAAAARQLVDGQRLLTAALPARWPAMQSVADPKRPLDRVMSAAVPAPLLVLAEPLLDLPPPTC